MQLPRPWRRPAFAAATAILAALVVPAAAGAATKAEIDTAVQRGAAWMVKQQSKTAAGAVNPTPNGSLPGFNGNWAITTLAAAGINAADVQEAGVPVSLQDYQLSTYPGSYATLPNASNVAGAFGREALIAGSAGIQVTKITPSLNLTASLASKWSVSRGDFGAFAPNSDGFALLATGVLHLPKGVRQKIVAKLLSVQKTSTTVNATSQQTPIGGWSFTANTTGTGDIDMTGAVLSMLCQEGMTPSDPQIAAGIDFLHRRLNPTTGGFGVGNENSIPPNNVPSAAWALIGLKACGVDPQSAAWTTTTGKNPVQFLLDQQRLPADTSDPSYGSMKYVPTTAYPAGSTDMNSAEAGIRALSDHRWLAPVPARANPDDPRLRPAPAVADGTTVPIALSVDDGAGDVRFCAVQIPSGASLSSVIETAKTSSIPAGCVTDATTSNGVLRTANGHTPAAGSQWTVRFNNGAATTAGHQPVRFGDVVALEIGAEPVTGPGSVDFGDQPQATIGAAHAVTFTATRDVQLRRARIAGANGADFLIADDGCADAALAPTDPCTVVVRFAPSAVGGRSATLQLVAASGSPSTPTLTVALSGNGTNLPAGAPGSKGDKGDTGADGADGTPGTPGATGDKGDTGAPGPEGAPGATGDKGDAGSAGQDGAAGAKGEIGAKGDTGDKGEKGEKGDKGAKGATGARGRDARITCRTVRARGANRTTCTVRLVRPSTKRSSQIRLQHGSRTYATGQIKGSTTRLRIRSGRTLTKGTYRLVIGSGRSATSIALSFR